MNQLRFVSLVGFGILLGAPALWAEAPSSAPSAASPPSPGKRPIDQQRERLLERLRERGVAVPSGSGLAPLPPFSAAPRGSSSPAAQAWGEELARKWGAIAATRHERRERHRAALLRELGQRLSDPQVKQELELHATRIAELSRIQFLAENARSGAQREKLLARVTKLLARENERHRLRLAALAATSGAPSASASAGPTPSPRASSGAPR